MTTGLKSGSRSANPQNGNEASENGFGISNAQSEELECPERLSKVIREGLGLSRNQFVW